jgi:ribonuclease Z
MLALVHVSTRYRGDQLAREARTAFPTTEVPRDFDTIEIPFPERGAATLIRASRGAGWPGADSAPAAPEPSAAPAEGAEAIASP